MHKILDIKNELRIGFSIEDKFYISAVNSDLSTNLELVFMTIMRLSQQEKITFHQYIDRLNQYYDECSRFANYIIDTRINDDLKEWL